MTEPSVGFAGNLTDQPEVRDTEAGIARARFRVAVSGRREQKASFFTVGVGRLQQRAWTAEGGSARSVVEVVADELGRACGGRRRRRPGRRAARATGASARWFDGC
jgi:single-stranded DNA-binding protein